MKYILLFLILQFTYAFQNIGINYATGEMRNHISDEDGLYHTTSIGFKKYKFFWRDTQQLQYLSAETEVSIAFQNHEIDILCSNNDFIYNELQIFLPYNHMIKYVIIGNELDVKYSSEELYSKLLLAMENVYNIITILGIYARVTTPFTMGVVGWTLISPPSSTKIIQSNIHYFLQFYRKTGSPFMINIYPYLLWLNHQDLFTIDYALTKSSIYTDNNTGINYNNLFDHELHAIYYALSNEGYNDLSVIVGETGWPTDGGEGASIYNACLYLNNVYNNDHYNVSDIFIFEAFDEQNKQGLLTEQSYGIFQENGYLKCII